MALGARSPSKHNQMLSRFLQRPSSSNDDEKEHPAKRQRVDDDNALPPFRKCDTREIPDSDADNDEDIEDAAAPHQTDLETALPDVKLDAQAIEEYEAFKASQHDAAEGAQNTEEQLKDQNWVKGKSSIYVDAFNLALDTVLEDESHLFDGAEMDVFKQWRELNYEAQYLFVYPSSR
jgi:Fanconi-associated nuclease 1